jgi:hypothetical protein
MKLDWKDAVMAGAGWIWWYVRKTCPRIILFYACRKNISNLLKTQKAPSAAGTPLCLSVLVVCKICYILLEYTFLLKRWWFWPRQTSRQEDSCSIPEECWRISVVLREYSGILHKSEVFLKKCPKCRDCRQGLSLLVKRLQVSWFSSGKEVLIFQCSYL